MKELSFQKFVLSEFDFAAFDREARVLDIGCGEGRHLRTLQERGCLPLGLEVDTTLVSKLRHEGFDVSFGNAEKLEFQTESLDGIVCSVVLPYTDERKVVAEWGRVLRPGGVVKLSAHGYGYALRQLLHGENLAMRFYAVRTIINTWYYRILGHRLPGWIGDTLLQSDKVLRRYYQNVGLEVQRAPAPRVYCRLPVFIYHELRKVG